MESLTGRGTTFVILLPAASGGIPGIHSESIPARQTQDDRPVLVMDDEEMIRCVAGAILRELGYAPVMCADGAEAVRLYREYLEQNRRFSAVILDMTVPGGVGGKAAAEQIRMIDPNAALFISTGYATDSLLDDSGVSLFNGMIKKPYNVSAFSKAFAIGVT